MMPNTDTGTENAARMIDIRGLDLSFGQGARSVQVLRDVSFSVAQGESFGLVGESGSGKTTVLRCLAGLLTHWRGELSIGGRALGRTLDFDRCRLVQMVFQDPYGSLHPRQTVARALREPLIIHRKDRREQRIDEVLVKVGLNPGFRDRFPHQLSGGQRQRVAIARALILEPRVLLLDEPTSALDVSVQAEILNLLADLRVRDGLTYLMVTHDLSVVAHLCDRLAVMQSGEIVETLDTRTLAQGTPRHDYTRMLVEASLSYSRDMATAA
ncbi:peptide/nickel transport system ATP-binding protein [Comamonas sp. BIGb0124]|nr:peptide/nickel transport system ATP-binding protein [Comamonas sp. BIGb0124]